MKQITNWRKGTVADLEANGLDDATVIHILSYHMQNDKVGDVRGRDKDRLVKFFKYHLDNKIPVVGHRFHWYDIPLCERLLGLDLSELMVIDTLILSWYLNTDREVHGLDSFHEDYGIKKPKVSSERWEAPKKESWNTEEGHQRRLDRHYKIMQVRCDADVQINKALWEDFKDRLTGMYAAVKYHVDRGDVDGKRMSEDEVCYIDQYKNSSSVDEYVDRILTFLMFKGDTAALREKTMWEVDVEALDILETELNDAWTEAKGALEEVMPPVPKYAKKNRPKKPFKKDGSVSATGQRWLDAEKLLGKKDEKGNLLAELVDKDTIKLLNTYDKPNANGTQQIKDWLYSNGWVPQTFEHVKDKEAVQKWAEGGFNKKDKPEARKVPQLSVKGDDGKTLCPSVLKLAEKVPQVMHYDKYTTVKHRLDMVKGFKNNLTGGKYLKARIGGFTNTLRDKHRELVNLPGCGAPYGERIRGLLIAGEGKTSLGSDLSALEDRTKHHCMLPYDPDYVATMMSPDYDPHLTTALSSGMISQEQFDQYMGGDKDPFVHGQRAKGKTTNYCSVYNGGPEAIALASGMTLKEAKQAHKGYWELNWAVKAIAEDQCVFTCSKSKKWLINPVNGFCYNLRKDSDRFSTLAQGTGSFFFDMWVDKVIMAVYNKFGVKRLSGCFHDEFILVFKDTGGNRKIMEDITTQAIKDVSEEFYLRRELGCDCQFGSTYADIH